MWELLSFIQGKTRRKCLEILSKGPRTPSIIGTLTGEHLTHISRALKELESNGLVECLTPCASKNRIYRITEKGAELLRAAQEMGE